MNQLIQAVKNHANENYEAGGWDILVECWEDEEIACVLKKDNCKTEKEAIDTFRPLVAVWADRQADARNSAF